MTRESEIADVKTGLANMSRKLLPPLRRYSAGELLVAATLFAVAFTVLFSFSVARARWELSDFAAHWTACRLIRGNPYDLGSVARIQDHLAASKANLQIMANPPWTALIFLPFSALPYDYAVGLWVVSSVAILWFVALYFWRALGQKDNTIVLAITFGFAPTIALLSIAQVDAILLLAMVLFLIGVKRQNWAVAAAGLALFSIKPHLMVLPAISILLWAIKNRHWRLLVGTASILGGMITLTLALNREVFVEWFRFLSTYLPTGEKYPTLPNVLGLVHPAFRFVPVLCGAMFVFYRFFTISQPDWKFELSLITALGLATSFYGYYHDQILALPLLYIAFANGNRRIFLVLFCIANALIFIHLEIFPQAPEWYYFPFWTASAWFLISLASLRKNTVRSDRLCDA